MEGVGSGTALVCGKGDAEARCSKEMEDLGMELFSSVWEVLSCIGTDRMFSLV